MFGLDGFLVLLVSRRPWSSLKAAFHLTLPGLFACFVILEGGLSLNSSWPQLFACNLGVSGVEALVAVLAMTTLCMIGTGDGLLAAAELQ